MLINCHPHITTAVILFLVCVFGFIMCSPYDDRFCFASGAPDNIKIWKFPEGNFLQNFTGHQAIVNTVTVNTDNVLVSGGIYDPYQTCTRNSS